MMIKNTYSTKGLSPIVLRLVRTYDELKQVLLLQHDVYAGCHFNRITAAGCSGGLVSEYG